MYFSHVLLYSELIESKGTLTDNAFYWESGEGMSSF